MANLEANMTGSDPVRGRRAAASAASIFADTSFSRSRRSSGLVKLRCRIWLRVLMRTSRAERLVTTKALIASTFPSRVLAAPLAQPDWAVRAASMASAVSDLPRARRAWRF